MASSAQTDSTTVVPRLIKFNGTLRDLTGKPIAGPVDVTFALYSQETGGAPLWFETQTVQASALGHYTVLLGAMTPTGVPLQLFTAGEARWLGVQVSNLPEQSRVLLVSVPYAMKAGDAETLGGKPASAFMLSSQSGSDTSTSTSTTLTNLITSGATNTTTTTNGTPITQATTQSYIPVFSDNSGTLTNSVIFQGPLGTGIGTASPEFGLDLNNNVFAIGTKAAAPGAGGTMRFRDDTGTVRWLFGIPGTAGSQDFFMYNLTNGHAPIWIENDAPSYSFYFKANGNVGIGTNSPGQKLSVTGVVESTSGGFKFPDGTTQTTAAAGGGGGTITGVTAGTGLSGGARPVPGCVVVGLSRMNRILDVDPANRLAVVEPGVVNQDLTEHLGALGFGLTYVPDPGSQVVSTIGGNVGNNAGGMHCLKYGVTANHVLGLELVLPDGAIVELGGGTVGPPGMDLPGFFVGSEGTLGIATRITVRILPLQETVVTQLALFPSVDAAANAVSGIMAAGILPAALELLDRKMMSLVDRFLHVGYPAHAGASLIIEMDGLADGMELDLRRVREVCQANDALELQTAQSEAEAGRLWLSRRAAYGAMARVSPTVYVMDVAVPRNLLAEAIRRVVAICDELKLDVVTLAHAGDGNLHPLILYDANDPGQLHRTEQFAREVLEKCVEVGGTITGEHGVGVEKIDQMCTQFGRAELETFHAVKRAFDPAGLLNPGKAVPTLARCAEYRGMHVHGGQLPFPDLPRF